VDSALARTSPDLAQTPAESAAEPAASRCVSVGPFRELAEATAATARLLGAGYASSQRAGQADVRIGYWVYLDGIPTRPEANTALTKLHANGVPDAYLIPGSETGDMISLGVFNQSTRANRLRDQVRKLGFEPVVADRTRHEDVYWVDLNVLADRQLDLDGLKTSAGIGPPEQHSCAETGG
jgi:hypothetical protein